MTNIYKLLSFTFILFTSFNGKTQNMYFASSSQFIKQLEILKPINLSTFNNVNKTNKETNTNILKKDHTYPHSFSLNYYTFKSNSSFLNSSSYIKYKKSILNPYNVFVPFDAIAYGSTYFFLNKLRK